MPIVDKDTDIKIYSQDEIEKIRVAGRLASRTLDMIEKHVKIGISTGELDDIIHNFIIDNNAIAAPLNYRGFPKSCCISINEVVCHGIPCYDRKLKKGDILNIDVTVIVDGYYGDTSRMYSVGDLSIKANRVVNIAKKSLELGMMAVKPGNHFGDIGFAIQQYAEGESCGVVRDFVGHGIGEEFHENPNVFHYGQKGSGPILKEGMVFTIEPMINLGTHECKIKNDGWTAVTKDKKLSAQWEHTICVTKDGFEILTLS